MCTTIKIMLFMTLIFLNSTVRPSHSSTCFPPKFVIITALYNENNTNRRMEYETCIKKNLQLPTIETIHVVYDTSKDDQENTLLAFLKKNNVIISYATQRSTYADLFEIANTLYPNRRIIVSNADIFYDKTLSLLDAYDLTGKFLAITRHDIVDRTLTKNVLCCWPESQDTWIFQTPLPPFKNAAIEIGRTGCDCAIAYQAWAARLDLHNPCLSINCLHLHLSSVRNYNSREIQTNCDQWIRGIKQDTIENAFS